MYTSVFEPLERKIPSLAQSFCRRYCSLHDKYVPRVREITVPSSTHTGRHEHFVDDLVSTLTKSATHNIPHSGYNPHTRPGWTKDVKHLHTKEREMRRIWLAEGIPRGMIFEFYRNYKRAKRHFRVALDNEFNNYMKSVYHDLDTRSRM